MYHLLRLKISPLSITEQIHQLLSSQKKMNTLLKNNSIILIWIPSHIGIHGNERVYKAEVGALLTDNTKIQYKIQYKNSIQKFKYKNSKY